VAKWSCSLEGVGVNPNFWCNKRVFITGHTGFKGSWLSLWLQQLGAELTGYALTPPTEPSLFDKADVAIGMNSIFGDIRDKSTLVAAVCEAAPDFFIRQENHVF
jgi:CDP-glucose 4,6-dehydratase